MHRSKRKFSSPVHDIWILIVDDHQAIRGALGMVFAAVGIQACDEAATVGEAIDILSRQPVDVVLLDLSLPDAQGLEALEQIKALDPELPVLVHSHHDDLGFITRSYELGADGYLVKGADTTILLDAVIRVAAGESAWTDDQLASMQRLTGRSSNSSFSKATADVCLR